MASVRAGPDTLPLARAPSIRRRGFESRAAAPLEDYAPSRWSARLSPVSGAPSILRPLTSTDIYAPGGAGRCFFEGRFQNKVTAMGSSTRRLREHERLVQEDLAGLPARPTAAIAGTRNIHREERRAAPPNREWARFRTAGRPPADRAVRGVEAPEGLLPCCSWHSVSDLRAADPCVYPVIPVTSPSSGRFDSRDGTSRARDGVLPRHRTFLRRRSSCARSSD